MKKIISIVLPMVMLLIVIAEFGITANAQETFSITVIVNGNGIVSPDGIVVLNNGETQTFTCTPNADHVISDIKFNNIGVTVNRNNQYTTPPINENSTLEVTFFAKASATGVSTFGTAFYSGPKSSITFGTVTDAIGFEIVEYGILCHETITDITMNTIGVRKFPAENPANFKGQYGIELDNSLGKLNKIYNTRAYAIYRQNGVLLDPVYALNTIPIDEDNYSPALSSDATLSTIVVDSGTLYPEFSSDTTEYYVLYDELPTLVPTITCTTSSASAQYAISSPSINEKATITVTAENGDLKTYNINFRQILTANGTATKYAKKVYYSTNFTVNSIPAVVDAADVRTQVGDYSGSSVIAFMKFDLSTLPTNVYLKDAAFEFSGSVSSGFESGNHKLEAFLCVDDNWDTNTAYNNTGYPPYDTINLLSKAPVSITSATYQRYTIGLNSEMLQDKTTISLALRKNFVSGEDKYVYIGLKNKSSTNIALPVLRIKYFNK